MDIGVNGNDLLECLVLYTKLYHKPFSAESLTAGLPQDGAKGIVELFSLNNSKSLFSRAAKRAGLNSKLVNKDLDELSSLVLPVILILNNQRACILESVDRDIDLAEVILPDTGDSVVKMSYKELKSYYIGYTFYLKKSYDYVEKNDKVVKSDTKHWFWDTLRLSSSIYKDVIIASMLVNIFMIFGPLFTMNVYDRVVPNDAMDTLWVLAVGIGVMYVLDMIIKLTRTYFLEIASKKNDIIMSSKIFERVLDIKMDSRPASVGSFANNIKEFDHLKNFFTTSTMVAFIDIPFSIIFLVIIYILGGEIVFIPMGIMAIVTLYVLAVRGPLYRSIEATNEASANKNSILIESLVNLETIKTMNYHGRSQWKWEEATGEIANKSMKTKILSSSIPMITQFFVQLNTIAVIIVGVYLISDKTMSMGALIAINMLSTRAIAPLSQITTLISSLEQTKVSFNTLNEIMNMPVEREDGKKFVERPPFTGHIEFRNVTFSYPGEDRPALNDVSFVIKPGEKVAIIGKIGSGKSTIAKLILGLYKPTSGDIFIDGIDIKQINPADIRRNLAYVAQDITLFKGTLKDNLILRAPHSDDERILRASKLACVDEFLNIHPLGYEMNVGEMGAGLSGGQRQSVSIARAFLIDSPIILFDEPTSMMDSQTEKKVMDNINQSIEHKTMLLITHKNSLLSVADRVIVMNQGKKILDGDKASVINKLRGGN
ncbi:MAG TPA: type I secretion system permease/ATPase [Campylobacterales bacterium]|nr:type I secretion system permease/ATPase [Campylobacterales bacterium]